MNVIKELKVFAKDLSILIVEDEILLNAQLVEIVSLFFKNVRFAYNGEEGLKSYTEQPADIVVTDITMPKMDGIKMSKKIKYIKQDQAIIIVSAHCHLDYISDIVDLGIKQFIRKPFDDNELLYRLLKVSEEIVLIKSSNEEKEIITPKLEITLADSTDDSVIYEVKLDADSFINTFHDDIQIDIDYLLELNEDLEKYIDLMYTNSLQEEYLHEMTFILKKMYTIISQMPPLAEMSLVIFELASFLEDIDLQSLTHEQIEKLNILEFIHDDISKFLTFVFVDKSTRDVRYLEDSLRSSIQQLKQNMFNTVQEEEEEFELF